MDDIADLYQTLTGWTRSIEHLWSRVFSHDAPSDITAHVYVQLESGPRRHSLEPLPSTTRPGLTPFVREKTFTVTVAESDRYDVDQLHDDVRRRVDLEVFETLRAWSTEKSFSECSWVKPLQKPRQPPPFTSADVVLEQSAETTVPAGEGEDPDSLWRFKLTVRFWPPVPVMVQIQEAPDERPY